MPPDSESTMLLTTPFEFMNCAQFNGYIAELEAF